jgi:hypothetical protein
MELYKKFPEAYKAYSELRETLRGFQIPNDETMYFGWFLAGWKAKEQEAK